jgi:protoporphyrin/coproporphyrin ferrochelatase
MSAENTAVLLLAHGTPEAAEDVPEFMHNITGGRTVSPEVIAEVARRYASIGPSPLLKITRGQAEALQQKSRLPVYIGMRNWKPYIAQTVAQMVNDGIERAAVLCMAPQNSRTSVGLYRKAVEAAAEGKMQVHFVESWHDHPQLIRGFAEKLLPVWREAGRQAGRKVPVIFTAHSVPEKTIVEGDPYAAQARQTAALVAAQVPALTAEECRFAFQSQGMSGGAWIGPTVEDTIMDLKRAGHQHFVIQPVGFVCDHVEILYDIDIAFAALARKQGMKLWRTESLNDSPALISVLADLATAALGERAAAAASIITMHPA